LPVRVLRGDGPAEKREDGGDQRARRRP
jgi:hypothetical protein